MTIVIDIQFTSACIKILNSLRPIQLLEVPEYLLQSIQFLTKQKIVYNLTANALIHQQTVQKIFKKQLLLSYSIGLSLSQTTPVPLQKGNLSSRKNLFQQIPQSLKIFKPPLHLHPQRIGSNAVQHVVGNKRVGVNNLMP